MDCPDGSKKDGGCVLPEIASLYCQFGTSRREIQIFDMFLPFEASRVEVPVAPRLSTFRLTAPGSRQPASAAAYTANISII